MGPWEEFNPKLTYFLFCNSECLKKVPIINPTDSLKFVRKGDIIGIIHPAEDYFNIPMDQAQQEAMECTALLAKQII